MNDTVTHIDSLGLRDQMETATAEWYLIGEADYCMSNTIEISTFSITSIARGKCKYISYRDRDKCDVETATSDKEALLYEGNAHLTKNIQPLMKKERDALWNKVYKDFLPIDEQCFEEGKFLNKVSRGSLIDYFNYRDI